MPLLRHSLFSTFGLFSFLILLMFSCNNPFTSQSLNKQDKITYQRTSEKAREFAATQPDSALLYADTAIQLLAKNSENDTALIPLLHIKAQSWTAKGNSDSAIIILKEARKIAVKASDTLAIAQASDKLCELFIQKQDYNQAETYIQETAKCYEQLKKEYYAASSYGHYGMLFVGKKNNTKAHEYLMKAYKIFENLDSLNALGWVCITIADNYMEMDDKPNATRFYKSAISHLTRVHDTTSLRTAYINMGVMYRRTNPDSAMACYQKVLALTNSSDPSGPPIATLYNIANLYLDQNQYAKAIAEFDKVLQICRERKLAAGIARVYSGYASVYIKQGNLRNAAKYDKLAVQAADSLGYKSLSLKLMRNLKVDYQDMGDYKAAYEVSEQIRELNATVLAEDNKAALENLEKLSKAEKKALENTILRAELKNDQNQLFYRKIIIAILIVALIVVALMFWNSRRLYIDRSRAYEVLMKRYKEEFENRKKQGNTDQAKNEIFEKDKTDTNFSDPLLQQLTILYTTEKPFLNPKLKVDDVAEKLNTSQKNLSLALKIYDNTNFNTFTNKFRIEEAKKRLEDTRYTNYKIEAIGNDCGFGSKQSFYNAFEQVTGLKPGYYRNQLFTS